MLTKTIDSLKFGSDTHVFTLPYGECSTASATATKTVAVQGSNFSLEPGARVLVKFTTDNTASSPTLNVSGSGAKAIYYRNEAISAGYLAANRIYEFVYDGSQWELIGDLDTNTTYTFNGAVSTIKDNNLTANRALISNNDGKVAASEVTTTELGYLDGVTSNIQTQLNDLSTSVNQLFAEKADKEFVVSIFEQLKELIEAGKTDEVIAVLDEAILDLAVLA